MTLQSDFYDLLKDVWSNCIKSRYAYQLLEYSTKKWKNEETTIDKSSSLMLKELEDIQQNFMIDLVDNYLWIQEKALQD